VAGLGITHQRGTVIPVDEDCRPLATAFSDSDTRALDAAGFLRQGIDPAAYYDVSGCPVVSFNGFAKVLWCRKTYPSV
jgi:sugar (pentulose or hexulose) kinase